MLLQSTMVVLASYETESCTSIAVYGTVRRIKKRREIERIAPVCIVGGVKLPCLVWCLFSSRCQHD